MIPKFLCCLLSVLLLVSTAAAQATIPDSVLVPLNQLAADLNKKALDSASKMNADAAVIEAQAVADTAAKSVADDVVAVNKSTEALQAAITAWVNQVQTAKSLKLSLPTCPPAPDSCACSTTTSVKKIVHRESVAETFRESKHPLLSRLRFRNHRRG